MFSSSSLGNLHGSLSYGYVVGFRPKPQVQRNDLPACFVTDSASQLPVHVYRFDAATGEIRVVADGFEKCNGPAFSPDGRTAYMCARASHLRAP